MRVFSFGGGVQSTAVLALAAQGRVDFRVFLFANTGEDSENPDTLEYVRCHAVPFAAQHGIELHELRREWRDGRNQTLYQHVMAPETSSVPLPVRGSNGAPFSRRCTVDFKVRLVQKWAKRHGGMTVDNPITVGLGISIEEIQRARTSSGIEHYKLEYPLLNLRMNRQACVNAIESAGLPVPPKSACFFCPWLSIARWRDLRDNRPDLFERAAEMEALINAKRERIGKDHVYLTDKLKPLREAVGTGRQINMLDDAEDACESGYCMT